MNSFLLTVNETLTNTSSNSSELIAFFKVLLMCLFIFIAIIAGMTLVAIVYKWFSSFFNSNQIKNNTVSDYSAAKKNSIENKINNLTDSIDISNKSIKIIERILVDYNVNNNLIDKYSVNRGKYPYLVIPEINTKIKYPVIRSKQQLKGAVEDTFFNFINSKLKDRLIDVFDNRILYFGNENKGFEPDFVVLSKKLKSLFIDIEIDEPYDGVTRKAIHTKQDNRKRDRYFKENGWVVIRFTEYQALYNPSGCLDVLTEVIDSIIENKKISDISFIEEVDFWDEAQSNLLDIIKYRENYLGITEFKIKSPIHIKLLELKNKKLLQNDNRNKILENLKLSEENRHQRDKRIKLLPEEHKYLIDGKFEYPSVTTIVENSFPKFDELKWSSKKAKEENVSQQEILKRWKDKAKESADLGTKLHEDIENYYNGIKVNNNSKEYGYFLNFDKENIKGLKPFRTEWKIFDEKDKVAGTVDMVFIKEDGEIVIFDWKRSEKVVDKFSNKPILSNFDYGLGRLSHIANNSFNKYVLQQSIYRYVLEENYNLKVSSTNLVILHPEYENYVIVKRLPYLKKEATDLLFLNYLANI